MRLANSGRAAHKGRPSARLGWQASQGAPICEWNGALAQLGERYNGIVEVSGSIPLGSTIRLI